MVYKTVHERNRRKDNKINNLAYIMNNKMNETITGDRTCA